MTSPSRNLGRMPVLTKRRISDAHVARLRAIVAKADSIHRARILLRTTDVTLEGALTGHEFRTATCERLEAIIDRVAS